MSTRSLMILMFFPTALTFGACASQPPASPTSARNFGPPRIMTGNPMQGGFRPTPNVTQGRWDRGFDTSSRSGGSSRTTGDSLPSGWHGFGGS